MTEYVYRCGSQGHCRSINFRKFGWDFPVIDKGTMWVFDSEKGIAPVLVYTCCSLCKRPISGFESDKVNKFLGLTIEIDDSDLDFLNDD